MFSRGSGGVMTIDEALTAHLIAETSSIVGRRIFYDGLPLGTELPALIIQCISDVKIHTHQGQNDTEKPIYQVTACGKTRAEARGAAEAVKSALNDFVGLMGGLTIQYITLEFELPDTLQTDDGITLMHIVALEYEIYYNKE